MRIRFLFFFLGPSGPQGEPGVAGKKFLIIVPFCLYGVSDLFFYRIEKKRIFRFRFKL